MELDELLPEIPTPAWETVSDQSAVGEAAFELVKAAAVYAHLAAGLLPTDGYTRNEAILAGLVVKVSKLGKAMLAMTAHLGSDRQLALAREVIEALATLAYLVDGSLSTAFGVTYSVFGRMRCPVSRRAWIDLSMISLNSRACTARWLTDPRPQSARLSSTCPRR